MGSQKKSHGLGILTSDKGKELTHMAAININKEQFLQLTQGDQPVLVAFLAPFCGYCRRIGPAFAKLAAEYS